MWPESGDGRLIVTKRAAGRQIGLNSIWGQQQESIKAGAWGETPNGEQGAGLGSRDQGWLPTGLPLDRVQGIFWTNDSGPKFFL